MPPFPQFARTYTVSCFWRKSAELPDGQFTVRRLKALTARQAVAATIVDQCLSWVEDGTVYRFDPSIAEGARFHVHSSRILSNQIEAWEFTKKRALKKVNKGFYGKPGEAIRDIRPAWRILHEHEILGAGAGD